MPTKRFYLLKKILQVNTDGLFVCLRIPSERYALQELLLTRVKTEVLTQVSKFSYSLKNEATFSIFINLLLIVYWNKQGDLQALVLLSKILFQRCCPTDDISDFLKFVHNALCKLIM